MSHTHSLTHTHTHTHTQTGEHDQQTSSCVGSFISIPKAADTSFFSFFFFFLKKSQADITAADADTSLEPEEHDTGFFFLASSKNHERFQFFFCGIRLGS